jgi:DNA topoisomerase-3
LTLRFTKRCLSKSARYSKLTNYAVLTEPLLGKKIKNQVVFNDKKVTDHHAIIPTGIQSNLQYNQQQVYDIITKRFIAVL